MRSVDEGATAINEGCNVLGFGFMDKEELGERPVQAAKETRRLSMKEQFTTTVRVTGKGETKARAFADALNHVQAAVMKASPHILLRIEPQDVQVVQARESVRKEAFYSSFAPGKTHFQRGAGRDRQRDCHQSRQGGFRYATLIFLLKGIIMFLIILIKSLIIGALVGVGVGAGAARMFHAPTTQRDGRVSYSWRTEFLRRDPASHFSFGLGFFFNARASSVAAGAFTQDVDHRIIPNWGAAALMIKNRNVGETLHDPKRMAIACGVIGMIVVTFLNLTASSVPEALQVTAVKVLVPAANLLVNTVMPVIFWLAAIDAGKNPASGPPFLAARRS